MPPPARLPRHSDVSYHPVAGDTVAPPPAHRPQRANARAVGPDQNLWQQRQQLFWEHLEGLDSKQLLGWGLLQHAASAAGRGS